MVINRLLVANRGEIACRILATARSLGHSTIAVFSEADANARHVRLADNAACIGPPPVSQSYLNIDAIIEAANSCGADAIHPGYGFLSENADFARACEEAAITFVGPPPDVIDIMGNKAEAKRRMIQSNVPCVPGYEGEDQSPETLLAAAEDIGYPVMLKAAAGGGGRGMRLVSEPAELGGAIALAASEAESAFGSSELILEKAISRARHVEIQVFADQHGNVIHMGERDCSIQRRHQKIIEESPCPIMTPDLREAMGAAAVNAARSVGYVGAGTVEFLLDDDRNFYFLEMNTRLQVEHPVTEMVTQIDLVALQLAVAQGEPLPFGQDEIVLDGHAIEARLYAEEPARDFLPSTGKVVLWGPPTGEAVRVDHGMATGDEISPYYDSMVAKVIAWGETRSDALRRLQRALSQTALFGPSSNRDFLIWVLDNPVFARGEATTAFLEENPVGEPALSDAQLGAVCAVLEYRYQTANAHAASIVVNEQLLHWSSTGRLESRFVYEIDDDLLAYSVWPESDFFQAKTPDQQFQIRMREDSNGNSLISLDGTILPANYHCTEEKVYLSLGSQSLTVSNQAGGSAARDISKGSGLIAAPMHGVILQMLVKPGQTVGQGEALLVLEAMKMQHEIIADIDGTIADVCFDVGDQVAADDIILEIVEAAS